MKLKELFCIAKACKGRKFAQIAQKQAKNTYFSRFFTKYEERRGSWRENSKTDSATLKKNLFGNFAKKVAEIHMPSKSLLKFEIAKETWRTLTKEVEH